MITLYSGIPGSGKSYKMVKELSRVKDKYFVVHNIDKLQEGYLGEYGLQWEQYIQRENMEVEAFFSKEYQIKFCEEVHAKYKRPVLVIIDESHEWFDKFSKTLKMWLSYHRHLDADVWLVAHKSTNLAAIYRSFIEVEYRAKHGSFIALPGYFIYNRILGGQRVGYAIERKKQEIFALYKSKVINSNKKEHRSYLIPAMAVIVLVGCILFFVLPKKAMSVGQKKDVKMDSSKNSVSPVALAIKAIQGNQLNEKYAFVGSFGNRVIVEDRASGEQLILDKMEGHYSSVEVHGADYCIVFSGRGEMFTLYNSRRFKSPEATGRPQRPEANGALAQDSVSNVVAR